MKLFEGKSPNERNKIIAALVLGVLALGSLFFAFGGGIFSSGTTVTVSASPTPRPSATPVAGTDDFKMPSVEEQNFGYTTVPVLYNPASAYAPDPGRNIFAFYEPPPPCTNCPTPVPTPEPIRTPVPTPTPAYMVAGINPQNVYSGSRSFRLEINGDRFEPDSRIYLSQNELPTQFISPQRLVAEVPAAFVAGEGPRQVIIQSVDGKRYSQQVMLNVQPQPKPDFQYIGMIARKRFNNDTAYFMESGRQTPTGARLNDVVGGRFRLISISAEKTLFEDVNLGFRHEVGLYRPPPGTAVSTGLPSRGGGFPGARDNFVPYTPPNPNVNIVPGQSIPGIPDNIPRYVPPANQQQRPEDQRKEADEDGDDGKP